MATSTQQVMAIFHVAVIGLIISTAVEGSSHFDRHRRLCLKDGTYSSGAEPALLEQGKAAGARVAAHQAKDVPVPQEKHLMRSDTSNKVSGSWTGNEDSRNRKAKRSKDSPKMQIKVYYETRCPYCVMFLNMSLGSLWKDTQLRDYVNISLYPYGNAMSIPAAKVSEGYKFWHPEVKQKENVVVCQHGSDECLGNLIQACAIHLAPQDKHMEFITCMSAKPDDSIEKASYECMQQSGLDRHKMQECVNGTQGDRIMTEMAKQTDAVPGRQGTPWVLVDGLTLQNPDNFQHAVCDGLDYGPSSCSSFINPDDYFPVMFQRMLDTVPKDI